MSTPSPDARAVVAAVDRLTTQLSELGAEIRRASESQLRCLVDIRQTPDDAPTTTAGRPVAGIDPSTDPVMVVGHWHPMSEQLAEEMNERSSLIQQWAAGAVETARAADEEQQRTARRRSLRNLLDRLDRSTVHTWSEGNMLRAHVETEIHEVDTLRAITADHRVETRALREKLERYGQEAKEQRERAEQAEAAVERVRAYAAELARLMKDGTNDHDIGRYDTAVCVLDTLREDAERFDEQQPDENARLIAEYQAAILRVLALREPIAEALERADYRPDMRRGDLADSVMPVILAALDGTEQPTTEA
ncbi:hypothetical protein [Streptomyces sp. ECR3.8]|uniref:hypothetical protein n=1 Tax=Streptomyces sp. ECR3.8 TaxID=3461009 RepID=UPI00404148C8